MRPQSLDRTPHLYEGDPTAFLSFGNKKRASWTHFLTDFWAFWSLLGPLFGLQRGLRPSEVKTADAPSVCGLWLLPRAGPVETEEGIVGASQFRRLFFGELILRPSSRKLLLMPGKGLNNICCFLGWSPRRSKYSAQPVAASSPFLPNFCSTAL